MRTFAYLGEGGGGTHMFVRTQEKNFYSHKNEKQENCNSFESKLCKICFTEQIINKCDT